MASNIDISLSAETRKELGKQVKSLRKKNLLPAVLYGQKIKNLALTLDFKEFKTIFKKTGESSLINLKIKDKKEPLLVLVHDFQKDPLSDQIIHVDFYKPDLQRKTKSLIPLKIKGHSPAVKNLGGTLIKNLYEIEVLALPMNIPHEIVVDISSLETLGSEIFVKELKVPNGVEILKNPEEAVVLIAAPARVEEDLERPIEEKVENVEGVVKEEEKEDEKDKEKGKKKETTVKGERGKEKNN